MASPFDICKKITKEILPAVRAAIAQDLKKYDYTEEKIASALGVDQVAISKYLNNRYSKQIKTLSAYIIRNKLDASIVDAIRAGKPSSTIDKSIDQLCNKIFISRYSPKAEEKINNA